MWSRLYIYANDQQRYRITTQLTCSTPKLWETFFPILGGMHTLSFFGAVGVLMANTGLKELLESASGSVDAILKGNIFYKMLEHCVKILWTVFEDEDIQDTDFLIGKLMAIVNSSRTAKLWCDGLNKPFFIIIMFVRAACEADWSLHVKFVELVLPYFTAAGHWNYLGLRLQSWDTAMDQVNGLK